MPFEHMKVRFPPRKIRYSTDDPNYGHCTKKYAYLKEGENTLTILKGCSQIHKMRNELLKNEKANPAFIELLQEILDGCPISGCYKLTEI